MSGDLVGKPAVFESFAWLASLVDEYRSDALDYLGSDLHAVMVSRVTAGRGEETLDCLQVLLFRVDNQLLTECWHVALDEPAWERFFR